jgi:xanthine/CO dehydrogenase XdhC/CoxF family maturation factor
VIERAVVEAALALRAQSEPFVVATVVAVTGSAYRRPGARMLVAHDRWVAGSISGGCLEGDVVRRGWWRTEGAAPILIAYDARVPDGAEPDELREGLGLGCNGVVEVLLERDAPHEVDAFAFQARCRELQQRGAMITVIGGDELPIGARRAVESARDWWGARVRRDLRPAAPEAVAFGASRVAEHGGVRVSIEAVVPPPRLFVLGWGHDAAPLAELGRALGWDVLQLPASSDHGAIVHAIDASDRAAVIVMNHNVTRDVASLGAALASKATYIGVLGPRRRTDALLAELGAAGIDHRLHAPVGLALGAETPAEIALSILAEVQAVLRDAPATPLSACTQIHEDAA